jgi:hypothetical protein
MNTAEQAPAQEAAQPAAFEVTVDYLPAAAPYHHRYAAEAILETVRTAAMAFFHVSDRQERDTYRYFLEFGGVRITDTSQTLAQLAEAHHHQGHELRFHLVEEITPGSAS